MVGRASAEQLARAKRLLAHEGAGAGASAAESAAAAGRIYEKLHAHLAPLVGAAGVQALLERSVKLIQSEFSFLEVSIVEGAPKLRACLQTQEPAVATESATAVFGTFFTLITTFIGERLTTQALRAAWPTIDEAAHMEKNK